MSSFSSTRAGNTMSGRSYISEATKVPNQYAWMELGVFDIPSSRSKLEAANTTVFNQTFASACASGEIAPLTAEPIRIVIELFTAESPRTCENFLTLCRGFKPRAPVIYEDAPVGFSYVGTFFHKIIPKFIAQGGDLTRRVGGGSNLYSVFGRQFNDENLRRSCDEIGLVGMANNGPNTNGSQFFIVTAEDKEKALEGRHCIFGRIVEGLDAFMAHVAKAGTLHGEPTKHIVVTACGACE